jgi:hypothetical protein
MRYVLSSLLLTINHETQYVEKLGCPVTVKQNLNCVLCIRYDEKKCDFNNLNKKLILIIMTFEINLLTNKINDYEYIWHSSF